MRTIMSKLSGVTYNNAQAYIPNLKVNDELIVIKDKNNKFDSNAIMIKSNNQQLGFLPKDIAAELKDYSEKNLRVYVTKIVGGGSFNYGVRIKINVFENNELKNHISVNSNIDIKSVNDRKVIIL